MRGLIPQTILRLNKVKAFTPNVHAQWEQEENERALIEWARKEEPVELRKDDIEYPKKSPFITRLTFLLP